MANPNPHRNALKHGLRTLSLGTMPKGASYVGQLSCRFRRDLEAAVMAIKGEISLMDAAYINTACRCERHALLAQRWLRHNAHEMTHDQRLNYSKEIANASMSRDKALGKLGIDKRQDDFKTLYATAQNVSKPEDDTPAEQTGQHETGDVSDA